MLKTGLTAGIFVFVTDWISKTWVLAIFNGGEGQNFEVLPFFNIHLVFNRGVSFGLFSAETDVGRYALAGFGIAASIVLLWLIIKATNVWTGLGYGLIMGGALGNSFDRVFRVQHAVVDFLDVHFAGWHFWTFNIADAAITIGVICLLIDMIIQEKTDRKEKQEGST